MDTECHDWRQAARCNCWGSPVDLLQRQHANAVAQLHCSCRSPARVALAAVLAARHRAGTEHAAQNLIGAVGGLALGVADG